MPRRTRFLGSLLMTAGMAAAAFLGTPFVTGSSGTAWAADAPKLLGKFDDWEAYSYGTGKSLICYAQSLPKTQLPSSVVRGNVYFMVTHRPGQNVRNEISMRAGYPYSAKSKPFATIGSEKYQMFTGVSEGGEQSNWAWLDKPSQETQMVKDLRAGSSMVIKGTSEKGTLTTDTYSLKGSGGALKKIDETCK
jgi:hypothetical protein